MPVQITDCLSEEHCSVPPPQAHGPFGAGPHTLPLQQPFGHDCALHTQLPPTHACPDADEHVLPHPPQLFGSVVSLTQLDAHAVRPELHWQMPLPLHEAPLPQVPRPHVRVCPQPSETVPQFLDPHEPVGTHPHTPGMVAPHVCGATQGPHALPPVPQLWLFWFE